MKKVLKAVEPILFDLKDGTLKRTAPSRFVQKNSEFDSLNLNDFPINDDMETSSISANSMASEKDDIISSKSKQQRQVNNLVDSVRKNRESNSNQQFSMYNSETTFNN